MKIAFLGDIFLSQNRKISIDNALSKILGSCDHIIANLEGPILKVPTIEKRDKAGPHLSQHTAVIDLLKSLQVTAVSLANNHIFDFGIEGLSETTELLNSNDIGYFGLQEKPDILVNDEGVSVRLIGAGEGEFGCTKEFFDLSKKNGFNWIFSNSTISPVKTSDFQVLFSHLGLEMFEHPLPAWRFHLKQLLNFSANDIVINSHPHVVQGQESVSGKPIFHSLGNFYFDQFTTERQDWYMGIVVIVDFRPHEKPQAEVVGIKFEKNLISHFPDSKTKFDQVTKLMCNDQLYSERVNEVCLAAWNDYYKLYFSNPIWRFDKILPQRLKRKLTEPFNSLLFQHNLQIETHRFVVEHALKLINKTY